MIRQRFRGLFLIAIACAAGSYLATYAVQQPGRVSPSSGSTAAVAQCLTDWLGLTPAQAASVREIEAAFAADRERLETKLTAEREQLAKMLEDKSVTNTGILDQVERVIAAHDTLERRVAAHLVAMRPYLTAEQQKRLLDRFASSVREGGGYRWRHGQPGTAEGQRQGGGPPPGRGPGGGRGRGSGLDGRSRHGEHTTAGPTSQSQGVGP
jgi:hypothetical protein